MAKAREMRERRAMEVVFIVTGVIEKCFAA